MPAPKKMNNKPANASKTDDKFKYLDQEAILGLKLPEISEVLPDNSDRFCVRKPFRLIDTSKFTDLNDFKKRAEDYFTSIDIDNDVLEAKWKESAVTRSKPFKRKPYLIQGFALALGFNSMREFNDFKTLTDIKRFPDSKYKDYYALLNRCILLIDSTLQSGAISEDYNNKAVENYSRNHLGYSDRSMGLAGENLNREIKINIVTFNNADEVKRYNELGGNAEALKKKGIAQIIPIDRESGKIIECTEVKMIEESNNNDIIDDDNNIGEDDGV